MRDLIVLLIVVLAIGCAKTGEKGATGNNGAPGGSGRDGVGCTVSLLSPAPLTPYGGAMVTCGTDIVIISNGAPGPTGPQGIPGMPAPPTAYTVAGVVDPCGDAPGIYDEVFLRFANGNLVASFSDNINGYNTRLSELPDGNYVTTDGSGCNFNVSTLGNTRTVSWPGGSESWTF